MYSQSEVMDFFSLFSGAKDFYGVTDVKAGKWNDAKAKLEVACTTIKESPAPSLISKHLEGVVSIGISPLKGDDTVDFGAIDIDDYDGDTNLIIDAIYHFQLPICPCYSKSKHLHLYFFFQAAPAEEAVAVMKWYASAFGCRKTVEIFPKQMKRDSANKAYSWINLPYFNSNDREDCRKMLNEKHSLVDLDLFLARAKACKQTVAWHKQQIETIPCYDAPPCIRIGYMLGDVGVGGRNNWLFSAAVYLRLKDENCDLDEQLTDINNRLRDPLPDDELRQTVLQSMKKDTYFYLCANMERCDKQSCLRCEYGVGSKQASGLSYGQLTQILTDPPSYEWVVNGQVMRFTDEQELMGQERFRQLCMRTLHIVPRRLDDNKWSHILNKANENVVVRQPEITTDDFDLGSIFMSHLVSYFIDKRRAQNINQIYLGRVYEDKDEGVYKFSATNLLQYILDVKGMRGMSNMEMRSRLVDLGAQKQGDWWSIPIDSIPQGGKKHSVDLGDMDLKEGVSNDF